MCLFCLLGILCLAPCLVFAQSLRKVAVYPFDDRTNSDKNLNVGTKISDALVSKLLATHAYTVVDRQYLEKIAAEKNLKLDGDFDPKDAAKSGLMSVVDVLIVGQIGAFHAAPNVKNTSPIPFVKGSETDGEADLQATARLISIERGVILESPVAQVQEKKILSSVTYIKGVPVANPNNVPTDLGMQQLVDKAIDDVATKLAKAVATDTGVSTAAITADPNPRGSNPPPPSPLVSQPLAPRSLKAKLLGLDGDDAIINKGSADQVRVGDRFAVTRETTSSVIGDDGKPLKRHKAVCDLVINSVEDSSAAGKCSGGAPQKGDEAVLAQ
jgi:curli biogenesis system outer membrane secretion channel CsgG